MQDNALAISDLIGSMVAQGDSATASRLATRWLAENPQDPAALRAAAWVSQSQGKLEAALEYMQRACASAPDDATLHKQFASLLASCKKWERALNYFRISLEIAPDDAHAWHLAGVALLQQGQASQALHALRRALDLLPESDRIRAAFAEAIFAGGLPDEALYWWRPFAESKPRDISIQLKFGELLSRNGRFEDALQHFAQLNTHDLGSKAGVQLAIAQVHEDMGDRAQATQAYQYALALRPNWPPALAALIQIQVQSGTVRKEDLQLACYLLQNPSLRDSDRALLNYAVGKVHDARSEFEQAIGCWHEANEARRRQSGEPQAQATYQRVRSLMLRCREWPFGCEACPPEDNEPQMVFIVGMPRSGTTLTERIIATHPNAAGCGELPELPLLTQWLRPGLEFQLMPWETPLNLGALTRAKRSYLRAATRNCTPYVLVDKAPLNFFNLWLASLLFPKARIIWCRRDPRDVAVSIYGENFALEERLCTRLDGIGHYINIQERLMNHWQHCLPLSFHEVRYESLVTHPEVEARKILEFVGLEWDPDCLQFHKRSDGVQTPSRWQVRQPIYTRSVGRWLNYREHFAPLIEVLDTKPT